MPQALPQTHVLAFQRTLGCQLGPARGFVLQLNFLSYLIMTQTPRAHLATMHSHGARHIQAMSGLYRYMYFCFESNFKGTPLLLFSID